MYCYILLCPSEAPPSADFFITVNAQCANIPAIMPHITAAKGCPSSAIRLYTAIVVSSDNILIIFQLLYLSRRHT